MRPAGRNLLPTSALQVSAAELVFTVVILYIDQIARIWIGLTELSTEIACVNAINVDLSKTSRM